MKNLYVGNLPHRTTEEELRTFFQPHGNVEKVSIVTDRDTGRYRVRGEQPACRPEARCLHRMV